MSEPNNEMREALEGMVWQFAYRSNDKRRRWLCTGGLSALEDAFAVLGWTDPHIVTDGGCEIADCHAWADCVGAYPRSKARDASDPMHGFGFLCGPHYHKWNGSKAAAAEDIGRSPTPSHAEESDK